jgi:hypothetical protein
LVQNLIFEEETENSEKRMLVWFESCFTLMCHIKLIYDIRSVIYNTF